jgi:hypothetical protein
VRFFLYGSAAVFFLSQTNTSGRACMGRGK